MEKVFKLVNKGPGMTSLYHIILTDLFLTLLFSQIWWNHTLLVLRHTEIKFSMPNFLHDLQHKLKPPERSINVFLLDHFLSLSGSCACWYWSLCPLVAQEADALSVWSVCGSVWRFIRYSSNTAEFPRGEASHWKCHNYDRLFERQYKVTRVWVDICKCYNWVRINYLNHETWLRCSCSTV